MDLSTNFKPTWTKLITQSKGNYPLNPLFVQARKQAEKQLLDLLKRHSASEEKFSKMLHSCDLAVAKQTSFEALGGATITGSVLKSVVGELRSVCEFPIRPDPELLTTEPSLTSFGRTLEMFGSKKRHVDPNVVAYQMMYCKLGDQVLSLIKVLWESSTRWFVRAAKCEPIIH